MKIQVFLSSLLFLASVSTHSLAQTLTGPTEVIEGETREYIFTDDRTYSDPKWVIAGGTKVSESKEGIKYYINVSWSFSGDGEVRFQDGDSKVLSLNITIQSSSGGGGGGTKPVNAGPDRSYCKEAGTIDLNDWGLSLTTGSWSGPAISGNQIDLNQLVGGTYAYTYTRASDGISDSMVLTVLTGGLLTVATTSSCGILSGILYANESAEFISHWEKSYDNWATWTTISTTSASLSYSENQNTLFRVAIQKSCVVYNSTSIEASPGVAGTISMASVAANCQNNSGSLSVIGNNGDVIFWEKSLDNGNEWQTISNSAGSTLSNIFERNPVSFRAAIKKDNCSPVFTSQINLEPLRPIGGIAAPFSVEHGCDNTSGQLELQDAKGTKFTWEKQSGSSEWIAIPDSDKKFLVFSVSESSKFRVKVERNSCDPEYSTVYEVVVSTAGGMASADIATACGEGSGFVHLTNIVGSVKGWEYSTDGANWNAIPGSAGLSDLPFVASNSTNYYRALIQLGDCEIKYSNAAIVVVQPPTIPGAVTLISENHSLVNNKLEFQATFDLINYQGDVQRWQKVADAIQYENVKTPQVLFKIYQTTAVRAEVKNGFCDPLLSGQALFVVNKSFLGIEDVTAPKQISEYEGYSYQIKTPDGISLQDGFSFFANSAQDFFVLLDDNYALPPNGKSFVQEEVVLEEGVKSEDDLFFATPYKSGSTYTYIDGLGRPVQEVERRNSVNQTDIATLIEYDEYGRTTTEYLPFVTSNKNGYFNSNGIRAQKNFYKTPPERVTATSHPYAATIYEANPLDLVKEEGAPGTNWQPGIGHTEKTRFEPNIQNEVILWEIDTDTDKPYKFGFYEPTKLNVTVFTDEQNGEVREYKNNLDQVLLRKTFSDGKWAETYYIYDDLQLLRYIIQPQGSATLTNFVDYDFLNDWTFGYKYDTRKRLVEKTLPGASPVHMIYDDRDRLVMSQDGMQRSKNPAEWSIVKYDELDRPIIFGIYSDAENLDREVMQEKVNNFYSSVSSKFFEVRGNILYGYTNNSFPNTSGVEYLTVKYYDDYKFPLPDDAALKYNPSSISGLPAKENEWTKGSLTGSLTRLLDGKNNWVREVYYFDTKKRVIQKTSVNHLSEIAQESFVYNFPGQVQKRASYFIQNGTTTKVLEEFQYDHSGRLLNHYHQINDFPRVHLKQFKYNALGELVEKNLHAKSDGAFSQSIDYRYNVRGWLTHINNSSLINDGGDTNDDANDWFGMELSYDRDFGVNNLPQHNSNISAVKWNADLAGNQHLYNFQYDEQKRLTEATYRKNEGSGWTIDENDFNETIKYDLNGNIQELSRQNGKAVAMDNLKYSYDGNTLLSVNDLANKKDGFNDAVNSSVEYKYNENGNLKRDGNKGLQNIKYNFLNLIERTVGKDGSFVNYYYDADGNKFSQESFNTEGELMEKIDYRGALTLVNGELKFVNHEDGQIIIAKNEQPEYQYQLKDHLGNSRIIFTTKEDKKDAVATFEPSRENLEQSEFLRYDQIRKVRSSIFDITNGDDDGYALRLNGVADEKIGLAKSLEVLPGDKIRAEVFAKYVDPDDENLSEAFSTFLSQIALGTAPPGVVLDGIGYSNNGAISFPLENLLDKSNEGGVSPKAYLNFLVFDEDFNPIDELSGFTRLSEVAKEDGSNVPHERLSIELNIKQRGFVYLFLSNDNEQPVQVYFDDFKVTHVKSPIIQRDDYYPFATSISETSYQKDNPDYKGTTYETRFGYRDLGFRNYDPLSGRFFNIDPLAELQLDESVYQYAGNNPIGNSDVLGLGIFDFLKKKRKPDVSTVARNARKVRVAIGFKKSREQRQAARNQRRRTDAAAKNSGKKDTAKDKRDKKSTKDGDNAKMDPTLGKVDIAALIKKHTDVFAPMFEDGKDEAESNTSTASHPTSLNNSGRKPRYSGSSVFPGSGEDENRSEHQNPTLVGRTHSRRKSATDLEKLRQQIFSTHPTAQARALFSMILVGQENNYHAHALKQGITTSVVNDHLAKKDQQGGPGNDVKVTLKDGGITLEYKGSNGHLTKLKVKTSRPGDGLTPKVEDVIIDEASGSAEHLQLFKRGAQFMEDLLKAEEKNRPGGFKNEGDIEDFVLSKQSELQEYLENLRDVVEAGGDIEDFLELDKSDRPEDQKFKDEKQKLQDAVNKFRDTQGIDSEVKVMERQMFEALKKEYENGRQPEKDVTVLLGKNADGSFEKHIVYKEGFFVVPTEKVITKPDGSTETIQLTGSEEEVGTMRDHFIDKAIENDKIEGVNIDMKEDPALNIFEKAMWVIKVTKTLLDDIEIKEQYWNNQKDENPLPFYIYDPLAGAGNVALDELKSIPDMIALGLSSVFDPEALNQVVEAVKNLSLSQIKEGLSAMFNDKVDKYTSDNDEVVLYQASSDGTSIVITLLTGGGKLLTKIKDIFGSLGKVGKIDWKIINLPKEKAKVLGGDITSNKKLADAIEADPTLAKSWSKLDDAGMNDLAKTDPAFLKNAKAWDDNGVNITSDAAQKKLSLTGNDGNKVAEITTDGKLIPEKYDYPVQGGTPIGEPRNGYQVVKKGDDVSVRRVADKSAYSQNDVDLLTDHPNGHVLERHGHDVTDEALIKRANTGIAPDGSTINTNPPFSKPPYSSKFDSPEMVKEALNNTKPGSPAFNSTPTLNGFKTVNYTKASGNLGKGVPRDGSSFIAMNKVRAVYQDTGGGNFKLLTMFPDI